jgi:hypothetical protein
LGIRNIQDDQCQNIHIQLRIYEQNNIPRQFYVCKLMFLDGSQTWL